jgi:hypothetical protein
LIVNGSASLLGNLDLDLVDGFSLATGQTFDIVGTGDGLTNGLTSLSLQRRGLLGRWRRLQVQHGRFLRHFTLSTPDPGTLVASGMTPADLRLGVSVTPVPEPSTWAMMLAGFAGIAFVAYRASRKAASAVA